MVTQRAIFHRLHELAPRLRTSNAAVLDEVVALLGQLDARKVIAETPFKEISTILREQEQVGRQAVPRSPVRDEPEPTIQPVDLLADDDIWRQHSQPFGGRR